jgi:predicted Rossmann fold flavoprotein
VSIVRDVIVIGAGPAGLLAAARAAERGRRVLVLEKNRKPGVKILMSGGTRCNLTHATDRRGIVEAFCQQGKFLHSALTALGPQDVVRLFEAEGVGTKVESTGKVFPASDKAVDVLGALLARLGRSGAELSLAEPVLEVQPLAGGPCEGRFRITTSRRTMNTANVVLTTGGQSYPGCGTTGDGYTWAARLGHSIAPLRPALVPVTMRADWAKSLRGIAIQDVAVRLRQTREGSPGKSKALRFLAEYRGAVLFAHFGLSGPAVLDISRYVSSHPRPRSLELVCDFLPDVTADSLAAWLQASAATDGKKQISVLLAHRLPRRLADALALQAGVPLDRRAAELGRQQRASLVHAAKSTAIPVTGTLGFEKAEVTAGGVALDEVDSRTMESKRIPSLFLAGEVLDLDGPIGGYNFQAAFSTGWLAGEHV